MMSLYISQDSQAAQESQVKLELQGTTLTPRERQDHPPLKCCIQQGWKTAHVLSLNLRTEVCVREEQCAGAAAGEVQS